MNAGIRNFEVKQGQDSGMKVSQYAGCRKKRSVLRDWVGMTRLNSPNVSYGCGNCVLV